MRRRILLSLMTIAVVATILGIGSWAVFNDTESTGDPYTVQAGTIDLELDETQVVGAGLRDLKPSQWRYLGPFVLHNAGGNPGVLDVHFNNIVDDGGVMSEPECDAEGGTWDDVGRTCDGEEAHDAISDHIDVDWCVDGDVNGYRGCDGTILGTLGGIESQSIDLDILNPSNVVEFWLSFHLQDVGNRHQGDMTTFDIEFTLHQLDIPAGATVVNLENKDENWQAIPDGIQGLLTYWTGSDLHMVLQAEGLTSGQWYQITLNGPHNSVCEITDDQLASGVEKYPLYDSGFWNGTGPYINNGVCASPNNEGIYNFAYVQSDASGNISAAVTISNAGMADPAGGTDVSGTYPTLPSGTYTDVKFIVKEITGAVPGTAWTPVLMEMATLNFTLP